MTNGIRHIVCLGYAKCGTTMLDSVFRESRLVATPIKRKEIKFFLPPQYPEDNHYQKYLDEFFHGLDSGGYTHTFEASPPYCHQDADGFRAILTRIVDTLPDPTIVICVRHPVVRAYSHYIHNLHSFALYGNGIYTDRPRLPNRIYANSFERALSARPNIVTSYHDYLSAIVEIVGADRLKLFFLESDVARFREWVTDLVGREVAAEIQDDTPKLVIPRRPVPNYIVDNDDLIAFGSRDGEFVRYKQLAAEKREEILASRDAWTLSLDDQLVVRLTEELFAEDLRACTELTGDPRFASYIKSIPEHQSASLVGRGALKRVHGAHAGGSDRFGMA